MARDNEPLVLTVGQSFEVKALDSEGFPITVEVRSQLAELLQRHPTPTNDALCDSILTTVMNLELSLAKLANRICDVDTRRLDLESRILNAGVPLSPSEYPYDGD